MKKKIVAAVLAGVLALTGIVPFIAETFSVRAEEASVIGEWFGNIWGTPAVMTLDKDGAFSIKYDNKDKTELTGKWMQKENRSSGQKSKGIRYGWYMEGRKGGNR